MFVELGNPFAIEGFREPGSDEVHYERLSGERVTEFIFPPDIDVAEAAATVVATLSRHMDVSEGIPAWIESDDEMLTVLLQGHYRLPKSRVRPATWGDGSNGPYPTVKDPDPKKRKDS